MLMNQALDTKQVVCLRSGETHHLAIGHEILSKIQQQYVIVIKSRRTITFHNKSQDYPSAGYFWFNFWLQLQWQRSLAPQWLLTILRSADISRVRCRVGRRSMLVAWGQGAAQKNSPFLADGTLPFKKVVVV